MPSGLSGRVGHALVHGRKVFRGLRFSDQILTDGGGVHGDKRSAKKSKRVISVK